MSFVLTGHRSWGAAQVATWWHAWSRMTWAHLGAIVVASLLMTVVSGSV